MPLHLLGRGGSRFATATQGEGHACDSKPGGRTHFRAQHPARNRLGKGKGSYTCVGVGDGAARVPLGRVAVALVLRARCWTHRLADGHGLTCK
jgi:hypothetical protein